MARLQRILKYLSAYLIVAIVGCLIVEWRWEKIHRDHSLELDKQISPYYRWSTYTSNGIRLGDRFGSLKLVTRPHIVYGNYFAQKTEHFTINDKGYRGDSIETETDKKRIVFVGGSTAFGTGLGRDEDTYAYQLERLISDAEVVNAGVIGHRSKSAVS